MAYSEHLISSMEDIPALFATFAESVGWIVGSTSDGLATVRHPTLPNAAEFAIYAIIAGLSHDLVVTRVDTTPTQTAYECRTRSPILGHPAATRIPSKLYLFGNLVPEPFLIATVEYGFNLYRHVYVGNMEKLGSYDGGEVFSASN